MVFINYLSPFTYQYYPLVLLWFTLFFFYTFFAENKFTMTKILLSFCLLFTFSITIKAATIKGTIKNTANIGVDKAAISLFDAKDSSLVISTLSSSDGSWELKDIAMANYFIYTSATNSEIDSTQIFTVNAEVFTMPTITLKNAIPKAPKKIDGVIVAAKKPMIEVRADKTIVNVESSINAAGSNALDILRKSPGVVVDKDDNISLKGKSGTIVYIDGKQTYLDNATIASILKGTQSSAIESIELISNPSAKYDAAGNAGIINIKMKKNKKLGTNGNVTAGLNYGYTMKENFSLSVNNNNKRTNIFGLYSVENGQNENYINFLRNQGGQTYLQKSKDISNGLSQNFKLGADYKINDKNTFGAMVNGNTNNGEWITNTNTKIGSEGSAPNKLLIASNNVPANSVNVNANINYKFADTNGRSLNIDVDAGNFTKRANSYQPNEYRNINDGSLIEKLIFKNNTPIDINIYTAKADYEQNAWKGKLGFGAKTSFVNTKNNFLFYNVVASGDSLNNDRTNQFTYKENVNALYTSYAKTINEKWNWQAGLRMEQTNSDGLLTSVQSNNNVSVPRSYIDFFPTAGISWNINPKHSLGLSFSRRITRPSYQDLNPFENKLDELTYQKGNAFLKPQYAYSTDLNYTLMQFLSIGLNYTRTIDLFAEITDTALGAKSYITTRNLANSDNYGINIGSPLPIKKWWFGYINLGFNYIATQANFNGNKINLKYPSYNFYMENNFTLPKNYSLSVSGWMANPGYWGGTFKTKTLGAMDIGVQKTLLNKKMTVKLALTDIFWSSRWRGISDYAGLRLDANGGNESRQLRLTVSYRFGSNSVQASRERSTGLSDEENRIKKK
jgi:iron complex outermembrane recepter protein